MNISEKKEKKLAHHRCCSCLYYRVASNYQIIGFFFCWTSLYERKLKVDFEIDFPIYVVRRGDHLDEAQKWEDDHIQTPPAGARPPPGVNCPPL
jgi:hypothetical protein